MARSLGENFESFRPSDHPGQELRAFDRWLRRFNHFIEIKTQHGSTASESDREKEKRRWLLHVANDTLLDAFEALFTTDAELQEATGTEIINRYRKTLEPNQTTTLTRFKFGQLKQEDNESFDAFANRLRYEITFCSYNCEQDRESILRDQVLKGCSLDSIRTASFKNEWKLADLITNGRRIEAAEHSLGALAQEQSDILAIGTNRHGARKHSLSERRDRCFRCDSSDHSEKNCPVKNLKCRYCLMQGHIEKACFRKKKGIPRPKEHIPQVRPRDGARSAHAAAVEKQTTEQGEEDFTMIASIQTVPSMDQVTLLVEGRPVQVLPDSGSGTNVIQRSHLSQEQLNRMKKSNTVLRPYGSAPIRPIGQVKLLVQWGQNKGLANFQVVETGCINLLGKVASVKLGILQINMVPVCQLSEQNKQFTKYPAVFKGIGKLKEKQVILYLKPDAKPVVAPYRPIPFHLREKVDAEIQQMLKDDIIEPVDGPVEWISNPVIVPKSDPEQIRICCDLKAVNACLQDTRKPIPTVEELKTRFAGKCVFSKVDFRSAFSQIEIAPQSRHLLVFRIGEKLYRYKRMPMGVLPASGEFMDKVAPLFHDIPGVALIHDDGIISGATKEEHDKALERFLQRTEAVGLTLNPNKCIFGQSEIPFWGCIIGKQGIRPDPRKVKALNYARRPETKEELISFLAMVRSNSDFIPQLAHKTASLRQLTKKWAPFIWTNEHQVEFDRLCKSFREDVSLNFFSTDLPSFLVVDASVHGLGAMLLQGSEIDKAKPIAVASRATTEIEARYPQIDLEALGVDFGLRRFRQYIVGGPRIAVYTDHKPLVPIFNKTRIGSFRTERIMLRNQDVKYTVIYREGKSNYSDYLSRHPVPLKDAEELDPEELEEHEKLLFCLTDNRYVQALSMERIRDCTLASKQLQRLSYIVRAGVTIPSSDELQPYSRVLPELTLSDGVIFRNQKIVLPSCLQPIAIELAHQGAHPGRGRMKARVRNSYWFPGMDIQIDDFVRTCHDCQLFTSDNKRTPVTSAPLPDGPWENVSLDLFGPMPKGNHVLVARDNYSRYPAAEIVKSTSAKHVLPALNGFYEELGTPKVHKTDSGPPFNGQTFKEYSEEKGIIHKTTPPLHPQANEAETFMKPLGKTMKIAHHRGVDKKESLDRLLYEYRNTPHPSTGVTPIEAMKHSSVGDNSLRTHLHDRDKLMKAKNRERVNAKRNVRRDDLIQGDWVLVRKERRRKFDSLFEEEPYMIAEPGDTMLLLRFSDGRKIVRHRDQTKKYFRSKKVPAPQIKSKPRDYSFPGISVPVSEPPQAEHKPPQAEDHTVQSDQAPDQDLTSETDEPPPLESDAGDETETEPVSPTLHKNLEEQEEDRDDASDGDKTDTADQRGCDIDDALHDAADRSGPVEIEDLYNPDILERAIERQTVVMFPRRPSERKRTSTFSTIFRDFSDFS